MGDIKEGRSEHMVQAWCFDKNGFYEGTSKFINEKDFNGASMTKMPLSIGYIKPKFNGIEWVEGATGEEIKQWEIENKSEPQLSELDKLKMAQAEQFEYILEILGGM